MGHFTEALDAYEDAKARSPNDPYPYTGYAEALRDMGHFPEALDAYEDAKARFPNDPYPYTGYAEALRDLGRPDDALEAYSNVMRQFPYNRVARNAKACLLIEREDFDKARLLLSNNKLQSQQDWRDHHVVAMSFLKQQNFEEAGRRLDYGLHNTPSPKTQNVYRTSLALLSLRRRKYEDVIATLADDPDSNVIRFPGPRLLRAHAEAELDRTAAAQADLDAVGTNQTVAVVTLREALAQRYRLGSSGSSVPSAEDRQRLDLEIANREFDLVLRAAA